MSGGPAAPLAAAAAVAAAVAALFGRVPLSFDTYFALLDGRDLAHGRTPDLELGVAATPHPLFNAVTALLSPLGESAEVALWVLVLLSFGAACVAAYRIAELLGGPLAGLIAAGLLATRPTMLEVAVRASVDVPALALVLWAIVLELRRPRRGAPVLVLLALAGLLRPEAWLMAGAYWLWVASGESARGRVRLGLLAAAGPLLWVAHDLALTGDPLWSRNHTADTVASSYRTGLDGLAEIPRHVGSILGVSGCVAAVVGLALAVRALRVDRRVPVLLAVLVLSGGAALALAIGGQPILQRFFLVPAAVLLVLGAGLVPAGRPRIALAVLLVALLPFEAVRIADKRSDLRADQRLQSELRELVDDGPARAAIEDCRPAHITAGGLLPTLAFELDVQPSDVAAHAPGRASVHTLPAAGQDELPYPLAPPAPPPAGQAEVERSRAWVVYRGCP